MDDQDAQVEYKRKNFYFDAESERILNKLVAFFNRNPPTIGRVSGSGVVRYSIRHLAEQLGINGKANEANRN